MAEWSEAKCAGYALAALVAGDRDLTAAAAIPSEARARTRALIAHEGSADKTPRDSVARRQLVEHLLWQVRPELVLDGSLPARMNDALSRGPRARGAPPIASDLWARLYRIARYHVSFARKRARFDRAVKS